MPADSPTPFPTPLGVENYQLGPEISTGGMGSVLEATDGKLDRTVAIKVMLLEANADARMRQRFLREAQVLAKLAHPNIVPIYDIVWEDGMPLFYSMKLVKGRTLHAILTDLRKGVPETLRDYSLDRLLTIFRKVCDAIAFAHSQGVLHRDLKPENIMVGEFGEVLVMDWGLAKVVRGSQFAVLSCEELATPEEQGTENSELGTGSQTLHGSVLGTPQYMSPEQARGDMTDVDELSDIYALGGILYAILTLRPPVEGATALEVLEKVSKGEITSPTALKASSGSRGKVFEKGEVLEAKQIKPLPHLRGGLVPSALSSVAMKALRLAKADRYASVTALSADIDAYMTGFATTSEQAGTFRQLQLLMLRHKVITASLAALLVVSLGFMVNLRAKERRAVAGEARSIIGLADAALRNGNGVRMQELLHTVPAEMRDSSWHYLFGQSDTSVATIQLNPPKVFSLAPLPRTPGGLAVAQSGGGISFIHARSGKLVKEFAAGISTSWAIPKIAVSPDGERIAIGQWDDPGGIVVRNIRSGQEFLRWDAPETKSLMFNADGSLLLQRCRPVNNKPAFIRIWDSSTGALLWQEGPPGSVFATFSPDGQQVIVSNTSSGLRIVDARDGKTIRRLPGEYHNVIDLAACREGLLAALDNRAEVIVFDLRDDAVLTRFAGPGPRSRDHFIGWTPDRAVLITAWQSADALQVVQLRNPRNGAVIRSLLGGRQGISAAAVHPLTGELVIGLGGLKVWDVRNTLTLLKSPSHPTPFLGFLGTDDTLVSYANPQSVPTVRRGSETLWTLKNSYYRFLTTSPNGAVAAIYGGDSRWPVLILERDGESVRQTRAITTRCQDHLVRLHPAGDQLAIFRDKAERFTLDGAPLPELEQGRIVQFNDIAWLPASGRMIGLVTMHGLRFSKGSEEHLVLWDAASGKQLFSVPHPTRMNFLAVMPDGRQFAEAGTDAMVRLRDADTLAVVHEFRAHDGPITALACHPTRRILATGSQDLCVRLWDADTGQLLEELRGPIQPPTQLIFSPSGHQLACSVANDECRLWKPVTLNQAIKDSTMGTTE